MEHGRVVVKSRNSKPRKLLCALGRNDYRKIVHMHDFSVAKTQDAGAPVNGRRSENCWLPPAAT
jgi:hypothetical protein